MFNNNVFSLSQSGTETPAGSRLSDEVSSHYCFNSKQMTDDEMLQFLEQIYPTQSPDFEKITSFAQGYPKMATLIVEAQLSQSFDLKTLNHDQLLTKLLWDTEEDENQTFLKILRTFSLFDVFSIEKNAKSQLNYIADLCNVSINTVTQCLQAFIDKGLIYHHGQLAQVTPKPIAIQLAIQWWLNASQRTLRELIEAIPDSLLDGVCHQIKRMDHLYDIESLTKTLYGPTGVLGTPEAILSNRGSRVFRAFVNISPKAACAALYKALISMDNLQRTAIVGDTRRNLLCGLEKLCAEANQFTTAGWCMLLLASAENESWSNNATDRFAQMFRLSLSGTKADPASRFGLLEAAMDLNQDEIDIVLLKALEQAVSRLGGNRIAVAGYLGGDGDISQEWRPSCHREVCEYWQQALVLSLRLSKRGDAQKEQVLYYIGHSIRGFVHRGCIGMLDNAIRQIIDENGPQWPAALTSIKNTFEYDADDLTEPTIEMLNTWITLLSCHETKSINETPETQFRPGR